MSIGWHFKFVYFLNKLDLDQYAINSGHDQHIISTSIVDKVSVLIVVICSDLKEFKFRVQCTHSLSRSILELEGYNYMLECLFR